jgi:hypothetical protein
MFIEFKNATRLYLEVDRTRKADTAISQVRIGYSRRPTPFYSRKKTIMAAVIALALFIGYEALAATDVHDTEQTVVLWK